MTTTIDTTHQAYGYGDRAAAREAVRDVPQTGNLRGKDVVAVLLAVTMILGPLAAGAFAA